MTVRYAPRALRDIDGILAYIHERSPAGARTVSLAIESTIAACVRYPGIGSPTDEADVYRRPLRKYRYTIFYRRLPDGEGIEVARVVHSARIRDLRHIPDE